jgi:hypothetical protein
MRVRLPFQGAKAEVSKAQLVGNVERMRCSVKGRCAVLATVLQQNLGACRVILAKTGCRMSMRWLRRGLHGAASSRAKDGRGLTHVKEAGHVVDFAVNDHPAGIAGGMLGHLLNG